MNDEVIIQEGNGKGCGGELSILFKTGCAGRDIIQMFGHREGGSRTASRAHLKIRAGSWRIKLGVDDNPLSQTGAG